MDDGVEGSSILFDPFRAFFEVTKTVFRFMVVRDK